MYSEEHMSYVKKIPMNCKPLLIIYLLPPPSFLFCGLLPLKYKITQTNFFTKSYKCYHVCFKRQFLDHVWRQNSSSTQLLIDPYLTQPYPKERVRGKNHTYENNDSVIQRQDKGINGSIQNTLHSTSLQWEMTKGNDVVVVVVVHTNYDNKKYCFDLTSFYTYKRA